MKNYIIATLAALTLIFAASFEAMARKAEKINTAYGKCVEAYNNVAYSNLGDAASEARCKAYGGVECNY